MLVLPPTVALSRLFRPVIWTLNTVANGSLRLFGLRAPSGRHVAYQREELVMLVGEARRAGTLEREEESLVRRGVRPPGRGGGRGEGGRAPPPPRPPPPPGRRTIPVHPQRRRSPGP